MVKKVLIIEDDNFLQGLEAKKLSKEGYEVLAASNSEEAFKILDSKQSIDMILLDLLLPGVDGFGVLENIRANESTKTTPVIVFSNLYEDKDRERASKLGVNEFMIKSKFTLDGLTSKIKALIG